MTIKKIYVVAKIDKKLLENIISLKPLALVRDYSHEGSIWLDPDAKEYTEHKQLFRETFHFDKGTRLDEDYLGAWQMSFPLYWAAVTLSKTEESQLYRNLAELAGISTKGTIIEHNLFDNDSKFIKKVLQHLINRNVTFHGYTLKHGLEFLCKHESEKDYLEVSSAQGLMHLRRLIPKIY